MNDRSVPDVCVASTEKSMPGCPINVILKLISAKWTVEIMREVSIQPTRTRQFLSRIPGLSMKCLQERLKELEAAGMILRVKYDEKVPRVEHSITARGGRLLTIIVSLKKLADESVLSDCLCPMESYVDGEVPGTFDCPERRS